MTADLRDRSLALLAALGACPTAPLHEAAALAAIRAQLDRIGLAGVADDYGNLIVHVQRGEPVRRLAFVAHTDHPAVEIVAVEDGHATAMLRGRVGIEYFRKAVPIQVITAGGRVSGVIAAATADPTGDLRLTIELAGSAAPGDFGVFDLIDFAVDGDRVHMRAADDLAGCAALLLMLEEIGTRASACDVYALFTRAEEIGLVGATLLAQTGRLPRDTIVISLEASRALPGAVHGAGPVIRVGDARRVFDPDGEALLLAAWRRLQAADPTVRVQRQLLAGGTCEATTFLVHGYRATGVAFPLGNYHNQGPDYEIAAEYIDVNDFVTGVRLLVAAVEVAAEPLVDDIAARLDRLAATWAPRLRASAADA